MKSKITQPYSKDRKPLHTLLPLRTPLTLYIDPSTLCNFSCAFCYNNIEFKNKVDAKIMDYSLFEKIVNDLKEFEDPIKMLHLYGFGEPLMNKNFAKMVKTLKKSGMVEKVGTTTNASLLTKEKIDEIIDTDIDKIEISIYGLNDEAYMNFSHKQISFKELVSNIKYLYENKKNCHLHVKINGNYYTEKEKNDFVKIFENISDTMYIDTATNIWPGIDLSNTIKIEHIYGQEIQDENICPDVFYKLMIHSNGNVGVCCVDYLQKINLGNVRNKSLKQIWESKALNQMRINHLSHKANCYEVCAVCDCPKYTSTVDLNKHKDELLKCYQKEKAAL